MTVWWSSLGVWWEKSGSVVSMSLLIPSLIGVLTSLSVTMLLCHWSSVLPSLLVVVCGGPNLFFHLEVSSIVGVSGGEKVISMFLKSL